MLSSDVVVLPRCHAASKAQKAWHDEIKNGLLFFDDDILLERLRDGTRTKGLVDRVEDICRNIDGFSGGSLVQQLAPFEQLKEYDRKRIKGNLDREFTQAFRPEVVAQGLKIRLGDFVRSLQRLLASDPGSHESVSEQLKETRDTLIALSQELLELPRGFWLPCSIDDDDG